MSFVRRATAGGREAMREPRARPSNIWWKMMTAKRGRKPESPAITRVMPITVGKGLCEMIVGWRICQSSGDLQIEWNTIPNSKTVTFNVSYSA